MTLMPHLEHHRLVRFFSLLPLVLGLLAAGMGSVALSGWGYGIPVMRGEVRGKMPMVPLAAAMFIVTGLALAVAQVRDSRWALGVSRTLATVVGVVALLTLYEYSLGIQLEIDTRFFREELARSGARSSGRVAINTALAFALLAQGILFLSSDRRSSGLKSQFFATLTLIVSIFALVGYAFGVRDFYSFQLLSGMSLYSAIGLTMLGAGLLFSQLERGLPALVVDEGAAGFAVRRLLPGVLILPILLTRLRVAGEEKELFGHELGASFVAVANMVAFLLLITWSARVLRATDRRRAQLIVMERQAHDASERARGDAEAAMTQALAARAEAESANGAKSDFLAVMSHELRTPLSAIMGYQELLADGITGPINDQQAQQLGRIKASARHLLSLIDEILTFTRLDAGKETLDIERLDLRSLLEQSAELIEPLAHVKHLEVKVVGPVAETMVETDATKVRQMLVNLLSNAVKFTDEGQITLTGERCGDQLCLTVCDTGIGIAQDQQQRIFEPFWQVEQSATRRATGTGLGLTVTRRLANLLGGDVTVTSTPGSGATFTIMLPIDVAQLTPIRTRPANLRAG